MTVVFVVKWICDRTKKIKRAPFQFGKATSFKGTGKMNVSGFANKPPNISSNTRL